MTTLSVNINKIATLRNSRGGNVPDVEKAAVDIESFGAQGITVHPRPDGRHIRYDDVRALRPLVKTQSFIDLVCEVKPDQVTLVPDGYDALTSNAGWDVMANKQFLRDVCHTFMAHGIRTSIFIDPNPVMAYAASECMADRIEMYTAAYAAGYAADPEEAVRPYVATADAARTCALGVNAGHDLNLDNLAYFVRSIPWLDEVSIGHALISDALYLGLEETIARYLGEIQKK